MCVFVIILFITYNCVYVLPNLAFAAFRFIMAELLQTERTYVKDMELCITVSCFTEITQLKRYFALCTKFYCKPLCVSG
jgi:hypothetical protein